jgi:sulfotransferase family protein
MMAGTMYHNTRSLFNEKIRLDKSQKLIIVVVSPHKVGSTWIYKILREMTFFYDIFPPINVFNEYRKVRIPLDELIPYFDTLQKGKGYLFKSHSHPPKVCPDYVKLITVIRDPRDVFVSMANYVGNLPTELGGWGNEFAKKPIQKQLFELINNSDFMYDLFYSWVNYDNCLLLKYEDLKSDIGKSTNEIIDYCRLNVKQSTVKKSIELNDFSRITGRKSGIENKSSFYRKGIVGDWKNHFNEELLDKLYSNQDKRWKKLISDLGYDL